MIGENNHGGGGGQIQAGDFTLLASNYARYRPQYSPFVLNAFLGLLGPNTQALHIADLGAGTGIWSRALAEKGVQVTAVEPNDAMRHEGVDQNSTLPIAWSKGTAEETYLKDHSYDAVCMASAFHWTDFDKAFAEITRILKPGGLFLALWNTRQYESNPLLVRIEQKLYELVPELNRISSGRSVFCTNLFERLQRCHVVTDVLYLEGRHLEQQSYERYIGIWKSVNDIRAQAGEERFQRFLRYIEETLQDIKHIDTEYSTRAWIARKNV